MRRLPLNRAFLFLLLASLTRPAGAQSYGLGDQVMTVSSIEFRPIVNSTSWGLHIEDGYLYADLVGFAAPLSLPDGAEIFQLCVYANIPGPGAKVDVYLMAWNLAPGGQPPGQHYILDTPLTDDIAIGYGTVCTDPFSYTFHGTADVDGDGTTEHVFHGLKADVFGNAGLGGLRVFWRRQVSPPPATPSFNDVPIGDGAFPFIEGLVASGVTAGCGFGNYCPDAPLTRRQMAVFLSKALGLHWAN